MRRNEDDAGQRLSIHGRETPRRARPIFSFLLLTFATSYLPGVPFNAVASGMVSSGFWATYIPRLVIVLGPAVAAVLVARAGGGSISVAQLVRSLRVPMRDLPWLVVIFAVGVLAAAASFALAGVAPTKLFNIGGSGLALLGAHLVIQSIVVGVGEELGWRGWLLPTLGERHSFASATALTGLAWIVWHLPVFFSNATWRSPTSVCSPRCRSCNRGSGCDPRGARAWPRSRMLR